MDRKETVVVDNHEPRSTGVGAGVGIAIAVLAIIILFFVFGGFNLFSGRSQNSTNTYSPTTNVQTPAPSSTTTPR